MAQLCADENFDLRVVNALRAFGHDVLTVQEAGLGGQGIGDPAILAFAIGQRRALLTFDRRDFKRLHQHARPHHGIIICSRDAHVQALASRIHQAIVSQPMLDDQLLSVIRPSKP